MAFEDRMDEMKKSLQPSAKKIENSAPRVSKSYTLKQELANELASRAKDEDLTASRYLERILKKEFNL